MSGDPQANALAATLEARNSLYFFARYMFFQQRGYKWARNWHHAVICSALTRVFNGECKRLIINIPPRYSKTELAVICFIAWCMGRVPDAEFIHTSYSTKLAVGNSARTKDMVLHEAYRPIFPGMQVRTDSRSKGDWRTTAGGVMYAEGAGGSLTGFGAGKLRSGFGGAIVIDDIHKADEARSDTVREGVIEWFKNTLESRTNNPDTPIIVIGQRLHERDLPGWLAAGGNGEEWEVVRIPAIAEEDDPWGRAEGEALWTLKHDAPALRRMQQAKAYEFSGQYQQRPAPREGGMFERRWFEIVDAAPASSRKVRKWDLAATAAGPGSNPDWTVGLLMSRAPNGIFYIENVIRFQGSSHEVEKAILNTATNDGLGVTVHLNQDPGQAGKAQVEHLTRALAGFTVRSVIESGSKEVRASPLSSQAEAGNVKLVKGAWNEALLNEFEMFPNGANDDQVDAGSGAFLSLGTGAGAQAWADFLTDRADSLNT